MTEEESENLRQSVARFDRRLEKGIVWGLTALVSFAIINFIIHLPTQTSVQAAQPVEKEVELSNGAVVLCLIVPTEHGQAMSCDWQRAEPPKKRPPKVL